VHKGLLLHVDAPVKQFILSLNKKHNYNIVINEIANDERKIFVAREFEDVSGQEQDTLTFLQGRLDHHLETITYNPQGATGSA
jgi:hypothetical protein